MSVDILHSCEPRQLEEAFKYIPQKILWLVPTWDCNRRARPCDICFASHIANDATARGYQNVTRDTLIKAQVLTKLPFKEVIITGGEPTEDERLLADTLDAIDPERQIRIITNGDWILSDKKRASIVGIIEAANRKVRIDVSAHDSPKIFARKIQALHESGKIPMGGQLRYEEKDRDYYRTRQLLNRYKMPIEVHHALELGQAVQKEQESRRLHLTQLMGYSTRDKNVGMYLITSPKGSRVIKNHEMPYVVELSPADIVTETASPQEVLKAVIDFYATPTNQTDYLRRGLENPLCADYALACFKAGVPLIFSGEFYDDDQHYRLGCGVGRGKESYLNRLNNLMSLYYSALSQMTNTPREIIKEKTAQAIAGKLSFAINYSTAFCIGRVNLPFAVANSIPRTVDDFAILISEALIFTFGDRLDRSKEKMLFLDSLRILGLNPETIKSKIKSQKPYPTFLPQ